MQKWIKVEDQLPEVGIEVLVYVGMPVAPSGELDFGFIGDDGEWNIARYRSSNVTHWMPKPEDPEAE